MGLAERKTKQRIGADPRNLAWAENAAKFGHTYLAKHGWAPGAGLGVTGDGRLSHIAVAQKLDQLGIGAGRPDGPDAIAWKQAKEFEGLLERLNATNEGKAGETNETEGHAEEGGAQDVVEDEEEKKKRKEEKAKRKELRREEKRKAKAALAESDGPAPPTPAQEPTPVAAPVPRRLAHRARFLAAKRLAGTSSTALSEILGVSSTPASTSTPSTPIPTTPTGTLTAIPILDDSNQITTSTQSVADYFKSKMRSRSQTQISTSTSAVSTPIVIFEEPELENTCRARIGSRLGAAAAAAAEEEEDVARPMGLGFAGLGFKSAALSSSSPLTTSASTSASTSTSTPDSRILSPENSEPSKSDKEPRKHKKRKHTDGEPRAAPAAEDNTTPDNNDTKDEDVDGRKASKQARKEAKRAARERDREQNVADQGIPMDDRPPKKKKKKLKVPAETSTS